MAVVIALFTVVVPSHQLTPVMTTLAVAVLVLFRRCRARYLPVLMAVLTTIWAVYVATTFVQGNLYWIIQSIARPFDNLDSNFIDLSRASAGQRFIAMVDRVLTGSVGLLAALGFARRLRHGYRDLPALLLLLAPFPMLVANSYGGEMVFRIYFFMLPFAAFFAAALVFPSPEAGASPGAPALVLLVSAGLLAGLCVAYYGKDRMYHFTENEIAAAEYLNATAGAGSLWIDGTWNWPVNYRGYELHDYRSLVSLPKPARAALAERPVDVVEQLGRGSAEAYLIITRSQKADVDMTGVLPAGTLDRVEQAMLQARIPVVFANQDATIFALRSPSQPAGR
jgi:hypothetical protein